MTGPVIKPRRKLSRLERDIVARLANGFRLADIARELGLSDKTLWSYKQKILDKLLISTSDEFDQYLETIKESAA